MSLFIPVHILTALPLKNIYVLLSVYSAFSSFIHLINFPDYIMYLTSHICMAHVLLHFSLPNLVTMTVLGEKYKH